MIVRPSQQDYHEYLMSCLEDRLHLFQSAWNQHIGPMISQPRGSVAANPNTPQQRDLFSRVLGFDHWHDMMNALRDEAAADDPRFSYLDTSLDLGTHLDSDFMESIQRQRIRLYNLIEQEPCAPKSFFSVHQGDHGPVEAAILMLHRIPSSVLNSHLPSLFTLNKKWAVLSGIAENRQHLVVETPGDSSFGMSIILETCQVPAAVFAARHHLTSSIAQRFQKKEITLADTRRNLTGSSTWTVSQHLDYLASIMVTPYPKDNVHQTIQQFIYSMINWMINESSNGQIQLTFSRLAEATSLNNYHIDNLSNARGGFDINALCVAVTPSIFLRSDDAEQFKLLAKKLVYESQITGPEFSEYERLFNKAVKLSRPARGLMLTALSDHHAVLTEEHLHNPQADIIYFDHENIFSASEWYSKHLHVDGMKHIVEELEYIPFGGTLFTHLPSGEGITEAEADNLRYLMESCDKRKIQMVLLVDQHTEVSGVTEYFRSINIEAMQKEMQN